MMKKFLRMIQSSFSTPALIYISIFIIACCFLALSRFICDDGSWWGNMWLNFGYGTFASLVVSLLIDIGNTKRNKKTLEAKYRLITSKCVQKRYSLLSCVRMCMEEIYSSCDPMTYEEYVEEALNPNYDPSLMDEEQYVNELYGVVVALDSLKESAEELIKMIPYCYDEKINDSLLSELNIIIRACRLIKRDYTSKSYLRCVNNIKCMKNPITRAFPELYDDFTNPYSDDEEE